MFEMREWLRIQSVPCRYLHDRGDRSSLVFSSVHQARLKKELVSSENVS